MDERVTITFALVALLGKANNLAGTIVMRLKASATRRNIHLITLGCSSWWTLVQRLGAHHDTFDLIRPKVLLSTSKKVDTLVNYNFFGHVFRQCLILWLHSLDHWCIKFFDKVYCVYFLLATPHIWSWTVMFIAQGTMIWHFSNIIVSLTNNLPSRFLNVKGVG